MKPLAIRLPSMISHYFVRKRIRRNRSAVVFTVGQMIATGPAGVNAVAEKADRLATVLEHFCFHPSVDLAGIGPILRYRTESSGGDSLGLIYG